MNIAQYITDIKRFRNEADQFDCESPGGLMQRITILTQAHMLIGRVSAFMDGEYKRVKAKRENTFLLVKSQTQRGDKTTVAGLAIMELREQEAEAYERMHLWRNEFSSLTEHLHEMRLRLRIDFNIGGGGV